MIGGGRTEIKEEVEKGSQKARGGQEREGERGEQEEDPRVSATRGQIAAANDQDERRG